MAVDFDGEKWQSFLPDVYHWFDKVAIQETSNLVVGGHHIVAVKGQADSGDKFDFLCDLLPDRVKQSLQLAANTAGWQPKAGPTSYVVEQAVFVLIPLPKWNTTPTQVARQIGIDATRVIKNCRVAHLVICEARDIDPAHVLDGLGLGLYQSNMFKASQRQASKPKEPLPQQVSIWSKSVNQKALERQRQLGKASALARMLQDAPPNWLDPEMFGEIARDVAKEVGAKCTILDRRGMEEQKMGSFLSVAKGSPKEPQFIVLEIAGHNNDKCVSLVGKGLTFDSGGLCIKPSQGMGEMKFDMSGGAAVLGAAYFLAKVKPPTKVVCVIGAVENMPSGTASRPSDIVVAMNGKSIDIQNTDAEGRLVLADCLSYVVANYKPEFVVDIATLTGAVLHALGHAGAAIMGNDQGFVDQVMGCTKSAGEPFWQLPLWPELEKEIKGDFADLANIAKPNVQAGTIIGGLFLAEFVGKTKWAHLDIAGTGWSCKATGFPSAGGSSFGMRTMSEVCLKLLG